MTTQLNPTTLRAIIIAGRFGFISRDIFWKHISQTKKSQNYEHWSALLASGYFKPYSTSEEYLYLTQKGIQFLQQRNCIYVGKAHPMNFEHDKLVLNFALACENAQLIQSHWRPDAVIRKQTGTETLRLLGASAPKLPDLVFDLYVPNSKIRIALEVERSRKSITRYDSLVLAYMEMKSIDLVIIAFNDSCTENRIKDSMKKLGYPQGTRPIAFCKLADLSETPSSFMMKLNSNVTTFDKFVCNLKELEFKVSNESNKPEKPPEIIPENFPTKSTS